MARVILTAMIAAAKADGQIDDAERQRILGKLEEAGADAEAREFVMPKCSSPSTSMPWFAMSRTQTAAQVYAASLLAIKVDTHAERDYLSRLAQRLGLDAEIVQRLASNTRGRLRPARRQMCLGPARVARSPRVCGVASVFR